MLVSFVKKLSNKLLTTNLLKSLLRISADSEQLFVRQSRDNQHLGPVSNVEKPGMILQWAMDQRGRAGLPVSYFKCSGWEDSKRKDGCCLSAREASVEHTYHFQVIRSSGITKRERLGFIMSVCGIHTSRLLLVRKVVLWIYDECKKMCY